MCVCVCVCVHPLAGNVCVYVCDRLQQNRESRVKYMVEVISKVFKGQWNVEMYPCLCENCVCRLDVCVCVCVCVIVYMCVCLYVC